MKSYGVLHRMRGRSWVLVVVLFLAALFLIPAINPIVFARADGLVANNGVNYLHSYTVSSAGSRVSGHFYPGPTASIPVVSWVNTSFYNHTSGGLTLHARWLIGNGTPGIYLGFEKSATGYLVVVKELLLQRPSDGILVGVASMSYYPNGSGLPTKVGDLYATNYSYGGSSTISGELNAIKLGLSASATNYSHSGNSTIKNWGIETNKIALAIPDMIGMLPSNVSGRGAYITATLAQSLSIPSPNHPCCGGGIIALSLDCILAILALTAVVASIIASSAACSAGGIPACILLYFEIDLWLPAAILEVSLNC